MCSLGMIEYEVPEVVVCSLCLGDLVVRLWLSGMDEIWKLHSILDEEDWNVVAHNIPIAFLRVELDSKPADISYSISATTAAEDGREADEDGSFAGRIGENGGKGDVLGALK